MINTTPISISPLNLNINSNMNQNQGSNTKSNLLPMTPSNSNVNSNQSQTQNPISVSLSSFGHNLTNSIPTLNSNSVLTQNQLASKMTPMISPSLTSITSSHSSLPTYHPVNKSSQVPEKISHVYSFFQGEVVCSIALSNPFKHIFTGGKVFKTKQNKTKNFIFFIYFLFIYFSFIIIIIIIIFFFFFIFLIFSFFPKLGNSKNLGHSNSNKVYS